jgi:hypothetical protein
VGDWLRTGVPNGQGRVTFNLQQSRDPVVSVETLLDGARVGLVTGDDLRNMAASYYTLPAVRGSYKLTVIAKTAVGCEDGSTRPLTVVVQ